MYPLYFIKGFVYRDSSVTGYCRTYQTSTDDGPNGPFFAGLQLELEELCWSVVEIVIVIIPTYGEGETRPVGNIMVKKTLKLQNFNCGWDPVLESTSLDVKPLHTFMAVQMSGQPVGAILQTPSPLTVPCSFFWGMLFQANQLGSESN